MNKDKISIQEIIDLVASKASVSKRVAEDFLKVFIATIEDALVAGETVKIKDFGTFKLQWNAARKSVNIQTGEEIQLSGFHKVTFTPENILKELVNEPFAHLEPVVLDAAIDEKEEEETEVELNPLRIFEEQASEIKNLISEIQALSPRSKKISNIETDENKQENVLPEEIIEYNTLLENEELNNKNVVVEDVEKNNEDINYISESELLNVEEDSNNDINDKCKVVINDKNTNKTEQNLDNKALTENEKEVENIVISDAEFQSNPFLEETKPLGKSRKGLLITVSIIILLCGGITSYFFFPAATDLVNNTLKKGEKFVLTFKDSASTTDLLNTISKWFTPKTKEPLNPVTIIVPKATIVGDSIIDDEVVETIDSLQILFDTPRVYPEYIATEKIVSGSRLARMSENYYGKSDFWVYIYEANQDRIPNPDNIPSGTLIYIPKVDPRLIDATNPRCLKKARELHDLYIKTDSKK